MGDSIKELHARKERFVADLNMAFARNDEGMAYQIAEDPVRYFKDERGNEAIHTQYMAINVTGNSLTAIAVEYALLIDGERSRAEITGWDRKAARSSGGAA